MASKLTELSPSRTVRRLVYPAARIATRPPAPLVVELKPEGVYLREKGRRIGYLVPYGMAYVVGARLEADRARREKAERRKARKLAR